MTMEKKNTPRVETWECEESISHPIFTPNFRDVPITPCNYGERGKQIEANQMRAKWSP